VTSGSYGPTAGANIGLALVPKGAESFGTIFEIEVHERRVRAEVVRRPFVPLRHKR
jgi:glycine cleavage system aminomethyltransferase T